jgi:chromosome segregation ATPase
LDYWQLGNYNRSNYHHNIKHHPQVKRIANIHAFIERVKEPFKTDYSEIKHFERRLAQVDNDIRKVMKLYRLDAIDEREIEIEMQGLQEQKQVISASITEVRAVQMRFEVSADDIVQVIENFREEVRNADPKIRKRAVQTLFDEIRIYSKEGNPWKRFLEVKGTKVPLTGVNVASPRGFTSLRSAQVHSLSPPL